MSSPVQRLAIVLSFFTASLVAGTANASENATRLLLKQGYELAYNLDHDEAVAVMTQAIENAPNDPATYRAVAAISWLRILFLRGGILVDNYLAGTGSAISRGRRKTQKPPEDLAEAFKFHIERAIELAEKAVDRTPADPDAHFELGTSVALAASYKSSIEGDSLRALRDAKRAYTAHQKVLELDPRRKDANLTLGLYRYLVSILPRAFRMVAYLVGFEGGKMEAIRWIEEAAAYPGETQSESQFALVLLYNREKEFGNAQRVLRTLKHRFPRNRIVWLESASTWLRNERAVQAEHALIEGFSKLNNDDRVRMYGEEALWHLKRGSARIARGQTAEALPDLIAASESNTSAWIKGQAYVELGKVSDLEGHRANAAEHYARGEKLCKRSKHQRCVKDAKELKNNGYSLQQ